MSVNHSLHLCVMRSKCQDVDVLYYPYACWTLTREEMSSHFPQPFTPTHWFRVNLLPQPFFTVANTFHLATWLQLHVYMFLFQSVVSLGVLCLIFQIKKWTSLHRSRCEVGGKSQKLCHWLSTTCNLPHKQNRWRAVIECIGEKGDAQKGFN